MNKVQTYLLTLCLGLLLFSPLHAQSTDKVYDVLVFHNGDQIKGTIVEMKNDDYVIIKITETGEEEKYMMVDVAKIKQVDGTVAEIDARVKKTRRTRVKPIYQFEERGRFTSVNFSFSFGKRERTITQFDPFPFQEEQQNAIGFNLQTVMGFQFSRKFGVGGGISYDAYNLEDGESVLTLLAHCRGYLSQKIIAPYWAFSTGYGFALENQSEGINEAKGGLMFHPELGLRLGASDKTNFTLSLGYRFQDAQYIQEFPFNGDIEYRNINYRRFLFSVGLLF